MGGRYVNKRKLHKENLKKIYNFLLWIYPCLKTIFAECDADIVFIEFSLELFENTMLVCNYFASIKMKIITNIANNIYSIFMFYWKYR